jgi:hypothetical protein
MACKVSGSLIIGVLQIYLCSKFDTLDTSMLLTDHIAVVGSSENSGSRPSIDFQGQSLELHEKTGGGGAWMECGMGLDGG